MKSINHLIKWGFRLGLVLVLTACETMVATGVLQTGQGGSADLIPVTNTVAVARNIPSTAPTVSS